MLTSDQRAKAATFAYGSLVVALDLLLFKPLFRYLHADQRARRRLAEHG